jgi:hypothetical protein
LAVQLRVNVTAAHEHKAVKSRHQFIGVFISQILWHHNSWFTTRT